jgi:hypothetical protein
LRIHKRVEIKVFKKVLLVVGRIGSGTRSEQIITDLDPDPGGLKTFGSYRSRTLIYTFVL